MIVRMLDHKYHIYNSLKCEISKFVTLSMLKSILICLWHGVPHGSDDLLESAWYLWIVHTKMFVSYVVTSQFDMYI